MLTQSKTPQEDEKQNQAANKQSLEIGVVRKNAWDKEALAIGNLNSHNSKTKTSDFHSSHPKVLRKSLSANLWDS